jgi:hypothetical protein
MLMLLDGSWKLVYTSNSELLAILALSRLPFVTIGDITQRIDSVTNTVENKVAISVPLSRTALSTTASFEVRSPKRLQVRFEKGAIQVRSWDRKHARCVLPGMAHGFALGYQVFGGG